MTFEEWQKQISKKTPFASDDEAMKEEETTAEKSLNGIADWPQGDPWSRPKPVLELNG
jgi:hypothetical protein